MSTKLWVEDRTQYTETDGEEEEGITLGGGSTNREEGREIRNKTGSRDKRRKREAGWRRRSDWTKHRGVRKKWEWEMGAEQLQWKIKLGAYHG